MISTLQICYVAYVFKRIDFVEGYFLRGARCQLVRCGTPALPTRRMPVSAGLLNVLATSSCIRTYLEPPSSDEAIRDVISAVECNVLFVAVTLQTWIWKMGVTRHGAVCFSRSSIPFKTKRICTDVPTRSQPAATLPKASEAAAFAGEQSGISSVRDLSLGLC